MRLFDSHAHLTDQRFESERAEVLQRAAQHGVEALVTIASNPEDAARAVQLARASSEPRVWATAGVHPHEADGWSIEALAELEQLAASDVVVAVGETGLDFHYENAPREAQIEAFRAQIEMAERLRLPLVVHSRDADDEAAGLVRECAGRVIGVMHCFTGNSRLLQAVVESGWYVSFSGIVTFASYDGGQHVRETPADRLLVETDSPYLAPAPLRGRRNEPSYVRHVVRRVAEIRGEDPEQVAEVTYQNACRFYGIGSG